MRWIRSFDLWGLNPWPAKRLGDVTYHLRKDLITAYSY